MRHAQSMRLIWIDAMLSTVGTINRADIARMFLISIQQASLDLRVYQSEMPDGVAYNNRTKKYERQGNDSLFDLAAREAVSRAAEEVRYWACVDLT